MRQGVGGARRFDGASVQVSMSGLSSWSKRRLSSGCNKYASVHACKYEGRAATACLGYVWLCLVTFGCVWTGCNVAIAHLMHKIGPHVSKCESRHPCLLISGQGAKVVFYERDGPAKPMEDAIFTTLWRPLDEISPVRGPVTASTVYADQQAPLQVGTRAG